MNLTEGGRRQRIQGAIEAWQRKPESQRETLQLTWRGSRKLFPVIELPLDVVLLNSTSHRLRSQLESHPQAAEVHGAPWSPEAQEIVAVLIRNAHEDFGRLKESLADEGQRQPGVITRLGILINANTRTVALRDLNDSSRRWIRVAVLPEDADSQEIAELELGLQVQEELKADYSLTNELLFIEELARTYSMSDAQIASKLRWATGKKGQADVTQHRRILVLIRQMQRLATPPVPLTFFDGKLEQLKALEQRYHAMAQDKPNEARHYLNNWLLAALAGHSSVHLLRNVDEHFVDDYLRDRLEGDAMLADYVPDLLRAQAPSVVSDLPGLNDLADDIEPPGSEPNVSTLINLLSAASPTVLMPDGTIVDTVDVKARIANATRSAIQDREIDDRAEGKLREPITHVVKAVTELRRAVASYRDLRGNQEFESSGRGEFEYHLRKLRKILKQFETMTEEQYE